MNRYHLQTWSTIAACVALLACGDDAKQPAEEEGRASILSSTAAMIAANALSDSPSQEFVVARSRVEAGVPVERTATARAFPIAGPGRAQAVATDTDLRITRALAAVALGTKIDPAKESDVASTQMSLDALLSVVKGIVPAANSCADLPTGKAEACAIAFLILEVQRSEGLAVDAGTPDAGSDAGSDAGTDAGITPANAILCPAVRDVAGAVEKTGSIAENQTWSGKILIKGSVYVNAQLTIEPGTQIWMDTDSSLYFAYTSSAAVFANGTAAQPITICGRQADKGYWSKLTIGDNVTTDSYLRNVLIADGGSSDSALGVEAAITLDNVQVANAGKDGVEATNFKAGSQLLTVRGAGGYPLVLAHQAALANVPRGGSFLGNTSDQISVTLSTIDTDVTVANLGVPYVQQNNLNQNKGNLVIEAGVEWRLKSDASIGFAYLDASSVNMRGTAAAPIKFAPIDANSQWSSITFYDKVNTNSVLSYVEFTGGGRNRDNAVQLDSPIKLDHVKLEKNASGLEISAKGLAAGSTALTITETAARPIVVALQGVYSIPADSQLKGNTIDQVQITAGTFGSSGTIPNVGVPYYLTSTSYDGSNVAITVAPGTEFVMGADALLSLGYYGGNTVTLAGTAAAPIKFRGEQALPGYWRGIAIGRSGLSNSKLDFLEISDAGGGGSALELNAPIAVTNTKVSNTDGYCIDALRSAMIDYAATNTLNCVTGPVNLN